MGGPQLACDAYHNSLGVLTRSVACQVSVHLFSELTQPSCPGSPDDFDFAMSSLYCMQVIISGLSSADVLSEDGFENYAKSLGL